MIDCKVCGKSLNYVTNSHLQKMHNMTPRQYLEQFPGAELFDSAMRDHITKTRMRVVLPICQRPGCGRQVSQSWNKYCSYTCSIGHRMSAEGRNEQAGAKNPQYKGGWYSLGKKQKLLARERDKYICQHCGIKVRGKGAQVHHIFPERCFDDPVLAHDLENLITLCVSCHKVTEWEMMRVLFDRARELDHEKAANPKPGHVPLADLRRAVFGGKPILNISSI